jgi:hypothetical protein
MERRGGGGAIKGSEGGREVFRVIGVRGVMGAEKKQR